jgi:hypothetical protein
LNEGQDGPRTEVNVIRRVVFIEELEAQLWKMGYRFLELSVGTVKSYRYYRETNSIDLVRYLPMERIRRGLSTFGPMAVNGSYMVVADVEKDVVARLDHRFSYTIWAERGAVKAEVRLHGRMDAPFPKGWPLEHDLEARLFVGPVAMGKGQKARVKRLVKEILALAPAFVEAFPEARIIAVLETRGDRGGWKRKEAWHVVVGQVAELVGVALMG